MAHSHVLTFRIAYLKQIMQGKKLHLKNDEKVLLHVPGHYDVREADTMTSAIGAISAIAVAPGMKRAIVAYHFFSLLL